MLLRMPLKTVFSTDADEHSTFDKLLMKNLETKRTTSSQLLTVFSAKNCVHFFQGYSHNFPIKVAFVVPSERHLCEENVRTPNIDGEDD